MGPQQLRNTWCVQPRVPVGDCGREGTAAATPNFAAYPSELHRGPQEAQPPPEPQNLRMCPFWKRDYTDARYGSGEVILDQDQHLCEMEKGRHVEMERGGTEPQAQECLSPAEAGPVRKAPP